MNEAEVYLKKLNYLESRIAFLERLERGFVEERGWIPIFQTAVYASPTSVTFANIDLTAYLKIGVKCSWYQSSGWRYGYVLSSSYGSGNTTLNFVANTSFNVANTAISTFKISYGNPPDFPAYLTYAAIVSGATGSAGTYAEDNSVAKFLLNGSSATVIITKRITNLGSWTGNLQVAMPIVPTKESLGSSFGFVIATSALAQKGYAILQSSIINVRFMNNWNTVFLTFADLAVNDFIQVRVTYEV